MASLPPSPPSGQSAGGPNCWQCRHFAVSWDPRLPYLCKLMGFKSRVIPALEVLRADGVPCRGFSAKPAVAQPLVQQGGQPLTASSAALSGTRR